MRIWLSIALVFLVQVLTYGQKIKVTETRSYEFNSSGKVNEVGLNKIVYEIDIDSDLIKEISVHHEKYGNTGGRSIYKIVKAGKTDIIEFVAIRLWDKGEALLRLDSKGAYYHFTTVRAWGATYTQLSFGYFEAID